MSAVSERESQVLNFAAEGKTDESIASAMGISVATVRGYWLRIRTKLGGSSRSELVGQWIKQGTDKIALQVDQDHEESAKAQLDEFRRLLDKEREAMDAVLKSASPEQRKQIAKIRGSSDTQLEE